MERAQCRVTLGKSFHLLNPISISVKSGFSILPFYFTALYRVAKDVAGGHSMQRINTVPRC